MSALDSLPADQRAVLQLVLKQGRTYEQIASMLRMAPDAVAERAYEALDTIGPEPPAGLSDDKREELSDYLLGQMSATGRRRVRDELEEDAGARGWARAVAAELRPLAGDALPEIPAEGAELDAAFDALSARHDAEARHERSSRLGGILLLAGLGVLLVAAILWATGVFGGGDDGDLANEPQATTAEDVRPIAQVNLQPTQEGSNAIGVAFVVAGNDQQAIRVDAEGLPRAVRGERPEAGACIFLQRDDANEFVGCFRDVDAQGRASASGVLPADVRQFQRLVVTRETGTETPTRPGRVILRGDIVAPQTDPQAQQGGGGTGGAQPPATQPGG
jgi:hypothetical protein